MLARLGSGRRLLCLQPTLQRCVAPSTQRDPLQHVAASSAAWRAATASRHSFQGNRHTDAGAEHAKPLMTLMTVTNIRGFGCATILSDIVSNTHQCLLPRLGSRFLRSARTNSAMRPHDEPNIEPALPKTLLDYVTVGISSIFLGLVAVRAWAAVIMQRCIFWLPHPLGWPLDLEIVAAGFRACAGRGKAVHMRLMLALSSWVTRLWPGTRVAWQDAGGVPAYWVGLAGAGRPSAASAREKELVLFYVHGGGFVAGHALMCTQSFWYWARCLQQQGISCQVLCVQYPLAPEQPFPAAVAATAACFTWLTRQLQGSKARIIGVGDSAGANLLIASLAALRDLHSWQQQQQQQQRQQLGHGSSQRGGLPAAAEPAGPAADPGGGTAVLFAALSASLSRIQDNSQCPPGGACVAACTGFAAPAAVVLVSPVVDLGPSAAWHDDAWTAAHEAAFDYLPHRLIGGSMSLYAGGSGSELLTAPHVSPVNLPSLAGLVAGPWLLLAGGAELLARDIDRFAARLRACVGAEGVQHVVEPHLPHSWAIMPTPSMWPRQARSVVAFLAQQVAGSGGTGR